jgi:hypothetical protein
MMCPMTEHTINSTRIQPVTDESLNHEDGQFFNRTGSYLHMVRPSASDEHPKYRFSSLTRWGEQHFAGIRCGYELQVW